MTTPPPEENTVTTDCRAALERLLSRLDETTDRDGPIPAWADAYATARATLALTQPEPAGEVTDEEILALKSWSGSYAFESDLVDICRAAIALALSRRAPVQPAEGEVAELVAALRADAECVEVEHYDLCNMTADQMRRAAELLAQLAPPQPVAVSERLPGDALCWWFTPESNEEYGWWVLETDGMEREPQPTHWLPIEALPLPATPEAES